MVEWPAYKESEGNSTAQRPHFFKGTDFFGAHAKWTGFTGVRWMKNLTNEPVHALAITNPAHFDLSPTTIFVTVKTDPLDDVISYRLTDPLVASTTLFSELRESTVTAIPLEFKLLKAITDAPEDQRVECMRALGLIQEEDEEDYVDPGPDPQPVDFDWLASIQAGRLPS
jgi:hypothetical protein